MNKQEIISQLASILHQVMPSYTEDYWQEDTELFGAVPEFDSMVIVTLIAEIEECFDVLIDDDAIDAENFSSIAALATLIESSD